MTDQPEEGLRPGRQRLPILEGRPWLLPLTTGVAGLIAGALATVGIMGLGAGAVEYAKSTVFTSVLEVCKIADPRNAEVGDDGKTLTINNKGEEDLEGLSFDDVSCIIDGLKTPQAVVSHINQTTSLDGRQTETWKGITFSWSYHPSRGIDGVFTIN